MAPRAKKAEAEPKKAARGKAKAEETKTTRGKKAAKEEPKKATRGKAKAEEPAKRGRKKAEPEEKPKRGKKVEEKESKAKSKKVKEEKPSKKKAKESTYEKETKAKIKKGKGKSKDNDVGSELEFFNPLSGIDDDLDTIEKDYALSGSSLGQSEKRLSTGMLTEDVIIGGGIAPGWYTFFGGEQSCKSTGANSIMIAALRTEVPVISMWDYEGSSSPEYIEGIMQVNGVKMPIEQVFGIRDPETSKWAVAPRVRYYAEGIAEKFFDYVAKLERTLPDKIQMGDDWYYVYESKNAEGKTHKKNAEIVGNRYDQVYFKKTGKYRIKAKDGNLQALLILDSLPAMLPEKQDVDDPGSAMAMQARMFSEQIKRIKGKLRSKRIAIIAVNQVRKAPMVMFGNPEYEPCGEAPKFYSDVRLRMTPRVLNAAPGITDKGMILEEKSVTGKGVDTYRMIHIRAHKNKLSVPNMEGWLRLWIEDGNGVARGFDPVWDTWRYLVDSGQCSGKRNGIKLTIKGKEAKKAMTWMEFKMLIIGSKEQKKKVFEHIGVKPFDIRQWCMDDLHNGKGFEKVLEVKRGGGNDDPSEAGGGGDDEE